MNADIKQAWLFALRGGEYKQTQGQLRAGDTFCCLGVLCNLHSKATGIPWDEDDRYFFESGALPPEVQEWAGLTAFNPDMPPPPGVMEPWTVAEYNDGKRDLSVRSHSFTEIADLIEQHL